MGQKCQVCKHNKKLAMERAYTQGNSISKIAREYGVSENSVRNHMQNHISRQMMTSTKTQQEFESMSLLTDIDDLVKRTKDILTIAEDKERYGLALGAIREVRGSYELLAKISWALHEARQSELEIERAKQGEPDPEQQKILSEMFDVLTPDEYELYGQLNMKMTRLDNTMQIKLKEKFLFEDNDIEEESNTTIPDTKDKSYKRSKQPLKQEQEEEPEPVNTPVAKPNIIPGSRSRVPRWKLGREINRQHSERNAIGGSLGGGESIPYSQEERSPDRNYAPDNDNRTATERLTDRDYAD